MRSAGLLSGRMTWQVVGVKGRSKNHNLHQPTNLRKDHNPIANVNMPPPPTADNQCMEDLRFSLYLHFHSRLTDPNDFFCLVPSVPDESLIRTKLLQSLFLVLPDSPEPQFERPRLFAARHADLSP
jgi:hypothetical protein